MLFLEHLRIHCSWNFAPLLQASLLLEQLERKIKRLPHFQGLVVDRSDWMGVYNLDGDDGISLVADHWRGVHYPNVAFVPIGEVDETVPFSITWRPENDNPALRRFLSLARIEAKRSGALF